MENIMLIIGLAVLFAAGFLEIYLLIPSKNKRKRKFGKRRK